MRGSGSPGRVSARSFQENRSSHARGTEERLVSSSPPPHAGGLGGYSPNQPANGILGKIGGRTWSSRLCMRPWSARCPSTSRHVAGLLPAACWSTTRRHGGQVTLVGAARAGHPRLGRSRSIPRRIRGPPRCPRQARGAEQADDRAQEPAPATRLIGGSGL